MKGMTECETQIDEEKIGDSKEEEEDEEAIWAQVRNHSLDLSIFYVNFNRKNFAKEAEFNPATKTQLKLFQILLKSSAFLSFMNNRLIIRRWK